MKNKEYGEYLRDESRQTGYADSIIFAKTEDDRAIESNAELKIRMQNLNSFIFIFVNMKNLLV